MTRDGSVLTLLRTSAVHVPPFQIARSAQVAPAEVDLCIADLREAGFDIELRPGYGYKLLGSPDRLIADDLWARLRESEIADNELAMIREIIVLEETGSTNDVAAQMGAEGVSGGVVIFAEKQTAGRGRFGRKWDSASHQGLWLSLLLRPSLPMALWPRHTTWAAVALARAIEQTAHCVARIKWPNDVMLSGRKAAGLLAETGTDVRGEPFLVLGLGVNVNQEAHEFPPELLDRATSLHEETGRVQDRVALAVALLRELSATAEDPERHFAAVVSEAARRSTLLGHAVQVRVGDAVIHGLAASLDEDGHLLVRNEAGALVKVTAGEATLSV